MHLHISFSLCHTVGRFIFCLFIPIESNGWHRPSNSHNPILTIYNHNQVQVCRFTRNTRCDGALCLKRRHPFREWNIFPMIVEWNAITVNYHCYNFISWPVQLCFPPLSSITYVKEEWLSPLCTDCSSMFLRDNFSADFCWYSFGSVMKPWARSESSVFREKNG